MDSVLDVHGYHRISLGFVVKVRESQMLQEKINSVNLLKKQKKVFLIKMCDIIIIPLAVLSLGASIHP